MLIPHGETSYLILRHLIPHSATSYSCCNLILAQITRHTMGHATEQKSIVSRSARLFLYSSPVANFVLFAVTFYVLSDHHSKLHQLQSLVGDALTPDVKHDSSSNRVLLRSARETKKANAISAVDKHLHGIINWQVRIKYFL